MLHGFGLYPVSLQIDIDSYDGDWRHVERFRNRCGWLAVARAEILVGNQSRGAIPVVAGCDEREEAIPSFMATNLLACATSRPETCYECPPDVLDELLECEKAEVRKRWLRDNVAAIAAIHDQAEQAMLELEAKASRHSRKSERAVIDLRRQRRFLAPEDPRRPFFTEAIADEEAWQEQIINWLADRRAQLRQHYETLEDQLSRGMRPRIDMEKLYVVHWRHCSYPRAESAAIVDELVRDTLFCPQQRALELELSDNQLSALAKLGRSGAWAPRLNIGKAEQSPPPPKAPLPRKLSNPTIAPPPKATDIATFMQEQLRSERAKLAGKLEKAAAEGRSLSPGSRKFNANRLEQTQLRGQITRLDRRIRAENKTERKAKFRETGRSKQDLANEVFGPLDTPPLGETARTKLDLGDEACGNPGNPPRD